MPERFCFWFSVSLPGLLAIAFLAVGSGNALNAQDDETQNERIAVENGWGHLTGRIIVSGEIPDAPDEWIPEDQATCLQNGLGIKDDNLKIAADGALADVFVFLRQPPDAPPIAVHPSYELGEKPTVPLELRDCRFHPHALLVSTKQKVILKNTDEIGHCCYFCSFRNDIRLTVAKQSDYRIRFHNADRLPGKITCAIHGWMDARILVRDNPYAALTQPDGSFEIRNIPTGTWKFIFWHSQSGYMKELEVQNQSVGRRGDVDLLIHDRQMLDLGNVQFPAAAFDAPPAKGPLSEK